MKPINALRMRNASSGPIDGTLGSTDAGILAAVYFTVSGTTPTIVGQKNVASVTRQATGVYRVTFTSALANTNYGLMGSARGFTAIDSLPMIVQPNRDTSGSNTYSTTTVDIVCQKPNDGTVGTDPNLCGVVIFDPQTVSSSNYKAAASWTVSGTTVTLQRALNVSSISRQAAGVYRMNFTSALPNANYSEFCMSRYASDTANSAAPAPGQNRNTTIPSNLHSTSALDLCTGHLNTTGAGAGNYDTARGSVLIGESNVAPRGTIARVRFSVSGGVVTIVESYNVASVTRSATGLFRVNFATAAADTDYAVFGSGKWSNDTNDDAPIVGADCNNAASHITYSTTAVDIATHNVGATLFDPEVVNMWMLKPWLM